MPAAGRVTLLPQPPSAVPPQKETCSCRGWLALCTGSCAAGHGDASTATSTALLRKATNGLKPALRVKLPKSSSAHSVRSCMAREGTACFVLFSEVAKM